jgi:hypothetical protein
MRLGAPIALGQQLCGQLCHHIAILGMHHGEPAQITVSGGSNPLN